MRNQATRAEAMSPEHARDFRYFVLTIKPGDTSLQIWMTEQHKQVLSQFENRRGERVVVIGD